MRPAVPDDGADVLSRATRERLSVNDSREPGAAWGWFPFLAAAAALGILLVVVADALSRSGRGSPQGLFWLGSVVIVVPIAVRLASARPGRGERISLAVLLGLTLYAVKLMRDPFGFTYPDELVHVHNANEILRTQALYNGNSILPVTPLYPGLEALGAALSAISGLGTFGAGIIVVGAARVVAMVALYLLYERLSGSARVAGIGALVYTCNSNYLFFSAQFSYESLALPLALMVLACVAAWRDRHERNHRRWIPPILLGTLAVVCTHHLTSYALVGFLLLLSALSLVIRERTSRNSWPFATFALVATLGWLVYVARSTVGYLTPVLSRALASTIDTVSGEAAPRHLFSKATYVTPLPERLVGIAAVLLLAVALPFGLVPIWRSYRRAAFPLALALAGAAYFGVLGLRYVPSAWEFANRSSEFLFVGLSFVVAYFGLWLWSRSHGRLLLRTLFGCCIAIVFAGGVIAGWPQPLRLGQTYKVKVSDHTVEAEGLTAARWAKSVLGPKHRFAASETNARLLLAYGNEFAVAGKNPDIEDILQTPTLESWQVPLLRENRFRYVLVDVRRASFDNVAGYFFLRPRPRAAADDLYFPASVSSKFGGPKLRAARIYDSGNIVIWDLPPPRHAPPS